MLSVIKGLPAKDFFEKFPLIFSLLAGTSFESPTNSRTPI